MPETVYSPPGLFFGSLKRWTDSSEQHRTIYMLSHCFHAQTTTYCAATSWNWLTTLVTTMDTYSNVQLEQLERDPTLAPDSDP